MDNWEDLMEPMRVLESKLLCKIEMVTKDKHLLHRFVDLKCELIELLEIMTDLKLPGSC